MQTRTTILGGIIAGTLSGCFAAVLASWAMQPKPVATQVTAALAEPVPPAPSGPFALESRSDSYLANGFGQRILSLEERVQSLGDGGAPSHEASLRSRGADDDMKAWEEEWARQQKRHANAPIDAAWSRQAISSLRSSFSAYKLHGGRVSAVECRTTSCIAEFEWPNYETATASNEELMSQRIDMDCTRMFSMPAPDDRSKAYSATMFLDCDESRGDRAN